MDTSITYPNAWGQAPIRDLPHVARSIGIGLLLSAAAGGLGGAALVTFYGPIGWLFGFVYGTMIGACAGVIGVIVVLAFVLRASSPRQALRAANVAGAIVGIVAGLGYGSVMTVSAGMWVAGAMVGWLFDDSVRAEMNAGRHGFRVRFWHFAACAGVTAVAAIAIFLLDSVTH